MARVEFIMNLKPLNRYIKYTKFKMTTLKQIQRVSQEWAMGHPDGYQIGVLPRSDASQTQVFPAFSIQGEGLPVQDSPHLAYQQLQKCSLDVHGQYFFTAAS